MSWNDPRYQAQYPQPYAPQYPQQYRRRRGMMPSAAQQAALAYGASRIAHRTAQQQIAMGVPFDHAVRHAARVGDLRMSYFIAEIPLMFFMLCGTAVPIGGPFALAAVVLGVMIGVRLHQWSHSRGDTRLVYRVGTGWLIVFQVLAVGAFGLGTIAHLAST